LCSLAKVINALDEPKAYIFLPIQHSLLQALHRVEMATQHLKVFPPFTFCFSTTLSQFTTLCFNALDSL